MEEEQIVPQVASTEEVLSNVFPPIFAQRCRVCRILQKLPQRKGGPLYRVREQPRISVNDLMIFSLSPKHSSSFRHASENCIAFVGPVQILTLSPVGSHVTTPMPNPLSCACEIENTRDMQHSTPRDFLIVFTPFPSLKNRSGKERVLPRQILPAS